MEVTIGVQNVARELVFESDSSAPRRSPRPSSASLEEGTVLHLTDDNGRQVLVPAAVIGYVQIGESEKGGVGFSTLTTPAPD